MGKAFRIDLRELDTLKALLAKMSSMDIEELEKSLGVTLESNTQERFETKKDPDGIPWKKWSDKYAKKASRDSRRNLLTGPKSHLKKSIAFESRSDGLYVGSTMVYARVHQDGWQKKNIPARPYLGVGRTDEYDLEKTVEAFLSEGGIA